MNNYFPNYYSNQYMLPIQMPNYPVPQSTVPTQPVQGLNGKMVDSADVVRATEVPMGGYGIFPKADLSEIYIKSWNNNGTTSIITFKPEPPKAVTAEAQAQPQSNVIEEIFEKITGLESKLDSLVAKNNSLEGSKLNNEY